MIFRSLASSSKGNAYLVTDGETTILIECGISYKQLEKRTGYQMAQIAACFITHEHDDHSHAVEQIIKHGIPLYASEGTARALTLGDIEIIEPNEPVKIGALRVMAFPVTHDAAQPVGYLVDDMRTRERLFFATDTRGLSYRVNRPTYIAVECNYEERLLDSSEKLPLSRKERIKHTHFEVSDVIHWLHKQDLSGVLTIWLLHLSAGNSRAEAWQRRFEREFPGIEIRICPE